MGFILGLFVGGLTGILFMAIFIGGKEEDEWK